VEEPDWPEQRLKLDRWESRKVENLRNDLLDRNGSTLLSLIGKLV
jgi:hypothetical protein